MGDTVVMAPRHPVGETPKRSIRAPGEIWDPARARAREEQTTITRVINSYLARYGTDLPEDAPTADPWDIVNLALHHLEGRLSPITDVPAAVDAAADLLRALGFRPQRSSS